VSNPTLQSDIKVLIEKNGPMGVNQLAKELDIPLSTMQKYLDKQQSYFKKNFARKWVLPEQAANEHQSVVSENYTNIINSQLLSMQALIDTLMSQFRATITLIETNKPNERAVAGKTHNMHPSMQKMSDYIDNMSKAIKAYISNVPEEYRDLIKNLDIAEMIVNEGVNYVMGEKSGDLTGLLLGEHTELTDETLKVLERYQK
jgi:hypothetical protein